MPFEMLAKKNKKNLILLA